jgi:hypothetical protein
VKKRKEASFLMSITGVIPAGSVVNCTADMKILGTFPLISLY